MKIGILIGRFQVPGGPHEGHRYLIKRIQDSCDTVLILFGSANRAPSARNPYSYLERVAEMGKIFPEVLCAPLNDYMYSDTQWVSDVITTIEYSLSLWCARTGYLRSELSITLYGHCKKGNDYLHWFPQYHFENVDSEFGISGTAVREALRALGPIDWRRIDEYDRGVLAETIEDVERSRANINQ